MVSGLCEGNSDVFPKASSVRSVCALTQAGASVTFRVAAVTTGRSSGPGPPICDTAMRNSFAHWKFKIRV